MITKRLLWVDDDGKLRFMHECLLLEDRGWMVDWAHSIDEAVEKLESVDFKALILDLSIPYTARRSHAAGTPYCWGGCILLWWLRKHEAPPGVPAEFRVTDQDFFNRAPTRNRSTPVLICSGYLNPTINRAMAMICAEEREPLKILPKPLHPVPFQAFIEWAEGRI